MSQSGEKVTVQFMQWTCHIESARYSNKRIWLMLVNADPMNSYLSPVAIASLNLVSDNTQSNEIAINDYGENEGMKDILVKAEIIYPPHRFVPSGYAMIPICLLNTVNFDFTGTYVTRK